MMTRTRGGRRAARAAAAAVLVLAAATTTGIAPAHAAVSITPVQFGYTGGAQTYVVPANVSLVAFDIAGASGGDAAPGITSEGPIDGGGGRVQGVLLVHPGETLTVTVGGSGQSGGFNGGGPGGGSAGIWPPGRHGGGATDIRQGGSSLANRVAVAGGGGGGPTLSGGGGVGGAAPGMPGDDDPEYAGRGGTGGGPGTLVTGGMGGTTTCSGRSCPAGSAGGYGSFGTGGVGGTAQLTYWCGASGGGGGGGGGYWGGGGGGAGDDCFQGAAGGGGSSYASPTAVLAPVLTPGYQMNNGYVSLTPLEDSHAAGSIAFDGSATLPTFPCAPPPPYGDGPCTGSFSGAWSGGLSGLSGTSAFALAWSAPAGTLNASVQYAEWQCLEGTETALGFAVGSGTATAQPGQVQGKWQVPGESFARDITAVDVSFTFSWTRVGTTATLVLDPFVLTIDVAGLGPQTVMTGPQAGSAVFVPTSQLGSGVPTCGNPLIDVQGDIAGSVQVVG